MKDESDGHVIDMARPHSSIREMIRTAGNAAPEARAEQAADDPEQSAPPAEDNLLPQPGDAYKAHARASNKPLPMIRFLCGDKVRGLPYSSLDSIDLLPADKPGGSPVIVVRFLGILAREARISGTHLAFLFDMLTCHRIGWIRELPPGRDFLDAKETVVTAIAIGPFTEYPA